MGAGVWSAWSAPGLAVVPLCAAVIVDTVTGDARER